MTPLIRSKRLLYKRQSGRLFCLIVMLILGVATINATGFLIRSQKEFELDKYLTETGDYDAIVYNVPSERAEIKYDLSTVKCSGSYLEVGLLSSPGCEELFKGAVFRNDESERMYHMPCIRGHYPQNANEVAIDVSTASRLGFAPYPGERISFRIIDEDGKASDIKEYVVSGVFEASSEMVWCGWFRYPANVYAEDEYVMPSVFFYDGLYDSFSPGNEVVFFKAQDNCDENAFSSEINEIANQIGDCAKYEINDFRANAFASSMGILDDLQQKYGSVSFSSVSKAIDEGFGKKDFFSAILIPTISLLILMVEVFAINILVKSIIADRKEYYAIFRLIGASSICIAVDIFVEFSVLCIIGIALGIPFGVLLHQTMIQFVNSCFSLRFESGLNVSEAVRVVTFNPIALSIIVCLMSLWLALISPIIKTYKMMPIELLSSDEEMFVTRKVLSRKKSQYNRGWLLTFCNRISFHNSLTMITLAAVMSVMLFGYCYFQAYSDQSTSEYQYYLKENNMEGFDYVARRSTQIQDAPYLVSNRHTCGVSSDSVQAIEESGMTGELYAVIQNNSTRLVFDEEPDEELIKLLGNHNLKISFDDTSLGIAGQQGQDAVWIDMGYDPSDYMYELPTVGIRETQMSELSQYLVAGSIDIEAIASGREVVVAVPEYLTEMALKYYNIGTAITFSDVLMTPDTEELNFNSAEAYSDSYKVYETTITDDAGNEIYTFASSYGQRHDITTTVGAIVALDSRLCSLYLTPDSQGANYYYDEETGEAVQNTQYGMALLVDDCYTFASWGLPDSNYTCVKATINSDTNINEFDQMWYDALSASKNVETISSYYYLNKVKSGTLEVMTIFYMMSFCLIMLGAVSVSVGLYAKVESANGKIMTLRRIGLSVKQVGMMIITQNIYYPIIAAITSVIPVFACQSLFSFILNKLQSGEWDSSYIAGEEPWYAILPYQKNLFNYNFAVALGACVLIGVSLIVIGTVPQIVKIKKNKMIETEE